MAVDQLSLGQLCHSKSILNRASKILRLGNWLMEGGGKERAGGCFSSQAYTLQADLNPKR